jgi:hypothetical protein
VEAEQANARRELLVVGRDETRVTEREQILRRIKAVRRRDAVRATPGAPKACAASSISGSPTMQSSASGAVGRRGAPA